MTPRLSIKNECNRAISNTELSSDCAFAHAFRKQISNYCDLISRELGCSAFFSSYVGSLFYGICLVVFSCSKKKMIRIYARGIVAARAIMAYHNSIRYFSSKELPRNPVRSLRFAIQIKTTISFIKKPAFPNPTRFRLFNFGQKSFGCLFFKVIGITSSITKASMRLVSEDFSRKLIDFFSATATVGKHLKLFLLGVQGPAVSAAGSVYFCTSD